MSSELDRKMAIARTNMAYKRVFESLDGQAILEDLNAVFGLDMPAYIPGADGSYNDTLGKLRDGQRSVFLHISAKLKTPTTPDGNVPDKPKVKGPEDNGH